MDIRSKKVSSFLLSFRFALLISQLTKLFLPFDWKDLISQSLSRSRFVFVLSICFFILNFSLYSIFNEHEALASWTPTHILSDVWLSSRLRFRNPLFNYVSVAWLAQCVPSPLVHITQCPAVTWCFSLFTCVSAVWLAQVDSNHRPRAYQARALTCWAMRQYETGRSVTENWTTNWASLRNESHSSKVLFWSISKLRRSR